MTEKQKYPMLRSLKDKKDFTDIEMKEYKKQEKAWEKERLKARADKKIAQDRKKRILDMTRGRYTREDKIPEGTEWQGRQIK